MNLDELERIAKAAQGNHGEWFVDKLMTDECNALGNAEPHAFEGYRIHATDGMVLECATLSREDADHIAAFSPDVVLKLLRVAKAAGRLVDDYNKHGECESRLELADALDALDPP